MECKVGNKQGDKVVSPNIYVDIFIAMLFLSQVKLGVRFKPRGTTGCLSCLHKLQWKGQEEPLRGEKASSSEMKSPYGGKGLRAKWEESEQEGHWPR
jgi:hypothetical protein